MLNDFIALSLVLTDERDLDRVVADEYLALISNGPLGVNLPQLLATFRSIKETDGDIPAAVAKQIMASNMLGPLAKQIVILWFTAQFPGADGNLTIGTPEQYFSGLVWSAVGAHVPGLSGGYFGHWKYPPEN